MSDELIVCSIAELPPEELIPAAQNAIRINPANQPPPAALSRAFGETPPSGARIAMMVTKRWPAKGVRLTVSFMDNPAADLRARLLSHMNAWNKTANIQFVETARDGQVRIARAQGGYWSNLGTDILHVPQNRQTMNLEGFTMNTRDSEFYRVVRHETGHTLGFPHEHMRREIVQRIDPEKATRYFMQTQGWSAQEVRQQVLTPLEESSLMGTPHTDSQSIMCYQLPGSITKDGQPIVGGNDIDALDYQFAASAYPPVNNH